MLCARCPPLVSRSLHCRLCVGTPASYSPPACVPAAAWRQDFSEFMSGSATIDLTLDDEPWASPVAPSTSPGPRVMPTSRGKARHAGAGGHAGLCPADMCNANAKEQLPMQVYAGSMSCTLTWGWAHLSHMGSLNASCFQPPCTKLTCMPTTCPVAHACRRLHLPQ